MNGGHSREAVVSLGPGDVVPDHGVSYRDAKFLVAFACGATGLNSIELNDLGEGNVQGFRDFLAGGLLSVNAGNFLDPANPRNLRLALLLKYTFASFLHLRYCQVFRIAF